MARHYYLTRSGRLRRKDNTLLFEPSGESVDEKPKIEEAETGDAETEDDLEETLSIIGQEIGADYLGELFAEVETENLIEAFEVEITEETENEKPVRVAEKRVIPVEDVDAIWSFHELDLNSKVLNFLASKKIPVHFFNYYGFYSGSFYPREYLQAGFLLVKQVKHYSSNLKRLRISRELIGAALHNILRNLRYYANRGVELLAETEAVQTEVLRLENVKDINQLMACEGRARSAYYQAFEKIIKRDVEFKKRVRRPPDNMVNALISFTNGLVYSSVLTQIYRSQLDPTISFLHEPGFRRFSLALDLAEVFKPILADRLVFRLFNNRQLSERDFAQDLNCCYLKDSGRKTVLKEWDARLNTTIEHRRLKRKVSYERLIRLECYKLVKHLTDVEEYKGFRAWW
ncbi:MAG: type I-B CRISPR-associated endonuclease Cas1b [Acidobacteriota bacterium]|nr:type I-B CRISPR-associated endonuclease Cas1b [Acidobacteriota bacterium]